MEILNWNITKYALELVALLKLVYVFFLNVLVQLQVYRIIVKIKTLHFQWKPVEISMI